MVFSSISFIFFFLPIAYGINYLLGKRISNITLLIFSILFYAWGEPKYVVLIIISIVLNYFAGILISEGTGNLRRVAFIVGIVFDVTMLIYYKYFNMIVGYLSRFIGEDRLNDNYTIKVALPLGISFFTFQEISYLIDVYKKETPGSKRITNLALYISFFPQLVAGPIVKYKDINFQIENRCVTLSSTADGYKRFIYGLSKKVLIANVLGECADKIYSLDITNVSASVAWIGAMAYTFQIYYDFSGYSDMAIGLGEMFGFTIPENFRYPYLSGSITEFWRRWHISLGAWFREYIYIPLGGSKKNQIHTCINLLIVFGLTGIWHGANISFFVWGFINGVIVVVERIVLLKFLKNNKILSIVYTFVLVNFGWVLFRASGIRQGICFYARMLMPWRYSQGANVNLFIDEKIMISFIFAVMGAGLIQEIVPDKIRKLWKGSLLEGMFCTIVFLFSVASIASDTYNPFIYFQF